MQKFYIIRRLLLVPLVMNGCMMVVSAYGQTNRFSTIMIGMKVPEISGVQQKIRFYGNKVVDGSLVKGARTTIAAACNTISEKRVKTTVAVNKKIAAVYHKMADSEIAERANKKIADVYKKVAQKKVQVAGVVSDTITIQRALYKRIKEKTLEKVHAFKVRYPSIGAMGMICGGCSLVLGGIINYCWKKEDVQGLTERSLSDDNKNCHIEIQDPIQEVVLPIKGEQRFGGNVRLELPKKKLSSMRLVKTDGYMNSGKKAGEKDQEICAVAQARVEKERELADTNMQEEIDAVNAYYAEKHEKGSLVKVNGLLSLEGINAQECVEVRKKLVKNRVKREADWMSSTMQEEIALVNKRYAQKTKQRAPVDANGYLLLKGAGWKRYLEIWAELREELGKKEELLRKCDTCQSTSCVYAGQLCRCRGKVIVDRPEEKEMEEQKIIEVCV